MAPVDDENPRHGLALEQVLTEELAKAGWSVQDQPVLGPVRPDLIATTPSGEPMILEVKTSSAPLHFATIAQVAAFKKLAEERGMGPIQSVLLTTAPISAETQKAADAVGVKVLSSEVGEDAGQRDTVDAYRDLALQWATALTGEPPVGRKQE